MNDEKMIYETPILLSESDIEPFIVGVAVAWLVVYAGVGAVIGGAGAVALYLVVVTNPN